MTVDPGDRELLAQFLGVAVVGVDIDRALEESNQECFGEVGLASLARWLAALDDFRNG